MVELNISGCDATKSGQKRNTHKIMKQANVIFLLILITQTTFAQKVKVNEYATVDKKALQLPDSLTKNTDFIASYITSNFTTDKDKSRAIFIWVASNIQYDVDNMFAINFYEKKEDKIAKPLKTRKGICENYALYRPEKSLHFLVNNPVTSLHIFFNPKYTLHLFNQMKRQRAML
ncbi:MAG: transglutaminase-like domain-containing protein, partial [Bacteroidia bacterium]